ncbi:MAG TPA: hypothetical protein VFL91_23405 [Thermomicrobiales bacterium]|nr:hypothetical protein [Thermomicrobiales bacterium]
MMGDNTGGWGGPPRRRGDGWSPGAFSPAIFLVAIVVVAFLVWAAWLGRRGGGTLPTATALGQQAPAPTAIGAGTVFVVGNTGGEGVYLRHTPHLDDRDTAYPDGTRLTQVGPDETSDGQTWRHVRAPDGRTGWVPAQYTVAAP